MRTIQVLLECEVKELELGKDKLSDDIVRLISGELPHVTNVKIILEQTIECCPERARYCVKIP